MESEVIEGVEAELRSYATRLEAGDETLLDDEQDQAHGGAFSGEELRAALLRAMSEGEVERLRVLPWGIGAAFRQGPGVPSVGAPGTFFACRTRNGERYWRFVEGDGTVIDVESEMLRRINPGPAAGVDLPVPGIDLESAWQLAVTSIVAEHNRRADPRADEERIGPAQRFAIDLLRDPTVALPPGADAAEEALAVGRSSTLRHALTEIRREVVAGTISRDDAARQVVEIVESFGLQPVEPPPLLDPVGEDDVGVVCWMAVVAEDP